MQGLVLLAWWAVSVCMCGASSADKHGRHTTEDKPPGPQETRRGGKGPIGPSATKHKHFMLLGGLCSVSWLGGAGVLTHVRILFLVPCCSIWHMLLPLEHVHA